MKLVLMTLCLAIVAAAEDAKVTPLMTKHLIGSAPAQCAYVCVCARRLCGHAGKGGKK